MLPSFYDAPGFIAALAAVARELPEEQLPDHVLISFHGLPERQIRKSDADRCALLRLRVVLRRDRPGESLLLPRAVLPPPHVRSRKALGLGTRALDALVPVAARPHARGSSPTPTRSCPQPSPSAASGGSPSSCPSFVADCLETIEEIGIRGREQWLALGGEELVLIPCVNAHPAWVDALPGMDP